ncbi:bifunctional phosphopantothenoylcysteine decarboxylase/phosphopantothenate--cysteine ligase CoaBC [Candidatus Gillettellia adelgis]
MTTTLSGKHIVLGVSGGIAAYKCPELVYRLRDRGAEVRVVMTSAAKLFILPLTFQTASSYPVFEDFIEPVAEMEVNHIALGKWADLIILAPATADLLARIAAGMANDVLTAVCLATNAPIAIVPSMNQQMYHATATKANLQVLQQRGMLVWGPDNGRQACGDIGLGRMLNPKDIAILANNYFSIVQDLQHLKIMITAGPTHEALDPVRFISNYSSGKMGFSIAYAAADRGAKVTLITGPVNLQTPLRVTRINVTSALEMFQAVHKHVDQKDIFISCAAVGDYRAQQIADKKIKKKGDELSIKMIKNPDIVASVANMSKNRPFVVGFSAETQNMEKYAKQKLVCKNLDLICANNVLLADQGFTSNTNALHLFWQGGERRLVLDDKKRLGQCLIDEIFSHYYEKNRY